MSNHANLTGTGVASLSTTCPAGSSEGHVSAGTLVLNGCLKLVQGSGGTLYFVSGSASALGLRVTPTAGTRFYSDAQFGSYDQTCAQAVGAFNSGADGP